MTESPATRRPPHRGVRGRIAIACAGLFLVLSGVLVAATYGLISHIGTPPPPVLRVSPLAAQCLADMNGALPTGAISEPHRFPDLPKGCQNAIQLGELAGAANQAGVDRRAFLVYSLTGMGLATLLAGGLGWSVSSRVLRPVRAITMAARGASQENLGQRLALTGPPDELKELADTFDGMLARLDDAFASQQRFVANASHELRTPLAEMRTQIDVTLAKPQPSAVQLDGVLTRVRAAVDRSEELIEALLTLAHSDRGLGETEAVDLPTAVEDAIDQNSAAAAARQITVDTSLQPAGVSGDRVLIERLASNLIDNAVRHNMPGGWITAATRQGAGFAELTITNSGQSIPSDQVAGLFEPFRRLSGRIGSRSGAGLGLSIVASVARAHGGQAQAHARPEGGLVMQIRLPATPPCTGHGRSSLHQRDGRQTHRPAR